MVLDVFVLLWRWKFDEGFNCCCCLLAISHFIPTLAHFQLMQQFSQQSFTPVSFTLALSLSPFYFSLRNHHQAGNLLLWFTQISTALVYFSLSLSFAYREIHSLFFSRLSRKSSILEIEKNFQLVRFSSTRNSQTVKLFIRRHSAKLFKKYLEKKRKKLSISIKQKKSFSLNKIEENCCEKTLLKEGKKKFRTNLCIKSFIIFIITRGVRKRKLLYVLLLLMKKI